jgi:hypothetical protein
MKKIFTINLLLFLSLFVIAQPSRNDSIYFKNHFGSSDIHIITFRVFGDTILRKTVVDSTLIKEQWDKLPQVQFWRSIMNLDKDSAFICEKYTRKIMDTIPVSDYQSMSDSIKEKYKDSLRQQFYFNDSTRVLFTTGKKFFYKFEDVISKIDTSISIFEKNGVDPWYSQSILLIESPNKLQKSKAGAYGPFQLMKSIARKYGLTVTKYCDERKDLKRSAYAASQLLYNICIPSARTMLDTLGIPYCESDLWFRLLVMHIYHAGAGNVRSALNKLCPNQGGFELINNLWQTESNGFRNASQNYSQVIIAAHLEYISYVMNNSKEFNISTTSLK